MIRNYYPRFHIAPPDGWLNDPNGSCFFNGLYHVFFQYTPGNPLGGLKSWGLMTSKDMINWKYEGIKISPDIPEDRDGAYSGTAFTEDGQLEIFYTGNVKHAGDYDYINEGRGHNVIYAKISEESSKPEKKVLLVNSDYPSNMSCHVRDPKVWKEKGVYYMLLGARTRDSRAGALLYSARGNEKPEKEKMRNEAGNRRFEFLRFYEPEDQQGYMWECPDYFNMDGKNILAVCPQGIKQGYDKFQNVYASGYFILNRESIIDSSDGKLDLCINQKKFMEWDKGFDFYAPQTFEAEDGRRILIGWAGVPDTPYDNVPSVKEGWQHGMTLPRELEFKKGKIYQRPIREADEIDWKKIGGNRLEYDSLQDMYGDIRRSAKGKKTDVYGRYMDLGLLLKDRRFFRITIKNFDSFDQVGTFMTVGEDMEFCYDGEYFEMGFLNDTGSGRNRRRAYISRLKTLDIFMDGCLMEIFVNGGEEVFTSRYYPKNT